MTKYRLIFDKDYNIQPYTLILSKRDYTHQGQLHCVTDVMVKCNLKEPDELSFTLHREYDDRIEKLWDEVREFKLIYVKELNEYFQLVFNLDDSKTDVTKKITCTSLCESELSQLLLRNLEINTETDIENEDYDPLHPTVFYNPDLPKSSLLHRVLKDKAPHYTIMHVDTSLWNVQRVFSCDSKSIYDFLIDDVAKEVGCLFQFDTTNRGIYVYDLETMCLNDSCAYYVNVNKKYYASEAHIRYRGEFNDVCPICGSTHIQYGFGEDTTIYVDKENLTDDIAFDCDTDAVKNTFALTSDDDDFDGAIRNINPAGTNYIMYFSNEMRKDMPAELLIVLDQYAQAVNNAKENYNKYVLDYYNALDKELEYEHSMMPAPLDDERIGITNGQVGDSWTVLQQLKTKITGQEIGISVSSRGIDYTNISSINNAIRAYANLFLQQQYFYADVLEGSVGGTSTVTRDGRTVHIKSWTGIVTVKKFSDVLDLYPMKLTKAKYDNLSAEEKASGKYYYITDTDDIGGTPLRITLFVSDDDKTYIEQQVSKLIRQNAAREETNNYYQMLEFKLTDKNGDPVTSYISDYQTGLTKYSLTCLETFLQCAESCRNILITMDQGKTDAPFYKFYQNQYTKMVQLIQDEINKRQKEVDTWKNSIQTAYTEIEKIRKQLIFSSKDDKWVNETDKRIWLNDDQYKLFCLFKREDEYSNSNFTSDGLKNDEILRLAREFYETAEKELVKSGTQQHTLSSTLHNLLVMKEFQPLVNKFQLGNYMRVRVENKLYRLRLISYTIDFESLEKLSVEFSDMTETGYGYNDIQNLKESVTSLTTTYPAVEKQSKQGKIANTDLETIRQQGLNNAKMRLMNNSNEETIMDSGGILCRTWDEQTQDYDPEQFRLTHNVMAYTTDNWNTIKAAIGKFSYRDETNTLREGYGVNCDIIDAGIVKGSKVIAGKIYSAPNSNGVNSTMIDLDNGNFRLGDPSGDKSKGINWDGSTLKVVGNIHAINGSFSGTFTGNSATFNNIVVAGSSKFTGEMNAINGSFSGTFSGNNATFNNITTNNMTANDVTANRGTYNSITTNNMTANNINVTSGTFGDVNANAVKVNGTELLTHMNNIYNDLSSKTTALQNQANELQNHTNALQNQANAISANQTAIANNYQAMITGLANNMSQMETALYNAMHSGDEDLWGRSDRLKNWCQELAEDISDIKSVFNSHKHTKGYQNNDTGKPTTSM